MPRLVPWARWMGPKIVTDDPGLAEGVGKGPRGWCFVAYEFAWQGPRGNLQKPSAPFHILDGRWSSPPALAQVPDDSDAKRRSVGGSTVPCPHLLSRVSRRTIYLHFSGCVVVPDGPKVGVNQPSITLESTSSMGLGCAGPEPPRTPTAAPSSANWRRVIWRGRRGTWDAAGRRVALGKRWVSGRLVVAKMPMMTPPKNPRMS